MMRTVFGGGWEPLVRRARRVSREIRSWREAMERVEARAHLAPEQVHALVDVLVEGERRQAAAITSVEERTGSSSAAVDALVDTERAWQLVRHILVQRRDPELGPMLQLADLCTADAYRVVLPSTTTPPPIVLAEAIESPVFQRRDRPLDAPGFARQADERRASWRVPLILLPPNHLDCVWMWGVLHHEVGHHVAAELGIEEQAQRALRSVLLDAVSTAEVTRWRAWAPEILADLIAVGVGGEGFVRTLRAALIDAPPEPAGDSHPPANVRLRLTATALERWTGRRIDLSGLPPTGLDTPAGRVVDILCGLRVEDGVLETRLTLDHESTDALAGELARGVEATTAAPWRSLPSAAQVAVDRTAGTADDLDRVHRATIAAAARLERPSWASTDDRWRFLGELLAQIEPTERLNGLKTPPVRLLCTHRRIAFVGATNERLPAMLRAAREIVGDRRWASIEVFSLSAEALNEMVGARSIDELVAARDEAEAELGPMLEAWCDAWALSRYDQPWFFGSWWDWEQRGGRIHVSPHVWGADVRAVPGQDHVWIADDPSEAYVAYREGLVSLRVSSRRR